MPRATLVVLVLLAVAGSQPAAASEPAGLKIVNKAFDAENGKITFDLLNTSDKLVTAWQLKEVLSADGRPGPEIRTGKDAHSCLYHPITNPGPPLNSEELELCGLIFPGQRVASETNVTPMPDGGYPVVSLKVEGVVYEDLSYEGDPAVADAYFAARAAVLEQIGRQLELLRSLDLAELSDRDLYERIWSRVLALRSEGNDAAIASGMGPDAVAMQSARRRTVADQLERLMRTMVRHPDFAAELLYQEITRLEAQYSFRLQHVRTSDYAAKAQDSGTH